MARVDLSSVPAMTQAEWRRARAHTLAKGSTPSRLQAKQAKALESDKAEKKAKAEVWKLDGGCCRWCRRKVERVMDLVPQRGEVHHVSGRVVKAIRWDVRNLILLCAACHERLTGKVGGEKFLIHSKHTFTVDGVNYINARKTVQYQRVQ